MVDFQLSAPPITPPRAVLVDDDRLLLRSMQRLLTRQLSNWDLVFIDSPQAALENLRTRRADVVVSDMAMGVMNGVAFMEQVQAIHPGSFRIVLSGSMEPALSCRSTQLVHQFLQKPIDAPRVSVALKSAYDYQALLKNEELRAFVAADNQLPSVPSIYTRLVRMIDEPNVTADQVADVVQRDVGLSARLMQIASSAFFGRRQAPQSVRDAVVQLGLSITKTLTLTFEIVRMFSAKIEGFSIEEHQQRSVGLGMLVKAMLSVQEGSDEGQLAGMLHGVGELVLASRRRDAFAACLAESKESGRPQAQVERIRIGASHAEVGAYLLGIWGLSPTLVTAVAKQHRPSKLAEEPFGPVTALYLARRLIDNPDAPLEQDALDYGPSIDNVLVERLRLASRLENWRELARKYRAA